MKFKWFFPHLTQDKSLTLIQTVKGQTDNQTDQEVTVKINLVFEEHCVINTYLK
jgi:hypothetical protein